MRTDYAPPPVPRLRVSSLSKRFGSNQALRDASLTVLPGEICGLVGTNGSGKSTLIKILSGVHAASPGSHISVDGDQIETPIRPAQLQRLGLSFVHQDLGLVDSLSVADNVRIGRYEARPRSRTIRRDAECSATAKTLLSLGSHISPSRPVAGLTAGERAIVAVARALQGQAQGKGCIVFDESTEVLPPEAVPPFFDMLRALARQGTSVILVSHRLDEVMAVTDHITVLRDGSVAGELTTAATTETEVARLMLGVTPSRDHLQTVVPTRRGATVLRCVNVTGRFCRDVSFAASSGEVVGLTGRSGSGYEELPYLLSGSASGASGAVRVGEYQIDLSSANPRTLLRAGLGLIPKDRAKHGLAMGLSVRDNLTLPRVGKRNRFHLSNGWQMAEYAQAADDLGIVPRDAGLPVAHLSGGNQQKVLLAKWMLSRPAVLLAHAPTQAVDVGARRDILTALRRVAASGGCVIVSASEAEDLAAICDRVLVFEHGRIVVELTGQLSAEQILGSTAGLDAPAGSGPGESQR